jgi:hypothetical protein
VHTIGKFKHVISDLRHLRELSLFVRLTLVLSYVADDAIRVDEEIRCMENAAIVQRIPFGR